MFEKRWILVTYNSLIVALLKLIASKDHMKEAEEEGPPILGSWRNLYLLLAGMLAGLCVFFYLFTKHFE